MENILDPLRSKLTLAFLLTYLINVFLGLNILNNLTAILIVCLLVINLPFLEGVNKYVSLMLLSTGLCLLFFAQANLYQWANALIKNAGLISLLISVPLLGIPLNFENFHQALANAAHKCLDVPERFYLMTNILAYSIGMLLNLAGITIVYQLFNQASQKFPRSLFITALTRGYSCCVFWSPNFISVAVILQYLELSWLEVAPWGFIFAAISVGIAYLWQKLEYRNSTETKEVSYTVQDRQTSHLLHKLIRLGLFLLLLIIFLEYFTGESVLVIVPLVAIIFPFIIALLWQKQTLYYQALSDYYKISFPNMKNEIVLFAVAGFFGQSLIEAGVGDLLSRIIHNLNIEQSLFYIIAIIGIMVLPSLIGIHPVVTGSTIAVTIPVTLLPLMPIQYALTLLTGWTLAILLSPFSGTVLVTSAITSETPFKVGMGWNWRYAIILSIVYVGILSLIG